MANKEATLILRIKEMGSAALDKVGDGVRKIGQLAVAAGASIAAFGALAIKNFREQELATNQLNQAMVNAGVFSDELRKKYLEQASALQKITTFGDETIIATIATLQSFSRQREVTEGLTKATLDFAAAKGVDLKTAAELVGKTIGSTTNALARYGIQVNATATPQEKMVQLTKAMNDQFGGQAQAAAMGLGAITQLQNVFSDFMESVGERIGPQVAALARIFSDLFSRMSESKETMQGFVAVFDFLGSLILKVKFAANALASTIGIGLAAAVESVKAATKLQFSQSKQIIKDGLEETKRAYIENQEILDNELAILRKARESQQANDLARDEQMVKSSGERKRQIVSEDAALAAIEKETRMIEEDQYFAALQGASYEQQLQAQIAFLDKRVQQEQDSQMKLALIKQKGNAVIQLQNIQAQKAEVELANKTAEARVNVFSASMNLISAAAAEGSMAAFLAQKAAAIAQTIVATRVAAAQALATPPAPNLALAGLAETAGNINLAAILATTVKGISKFADGGIVKASSGGTLGVIGEAGRDEAVIPLDSPEAADRLGGMCGNNITVVVNGGLLGDQSSARELAVAIDRELLKLRQSNESMAFDSGIV